MIRLLKKIYSEPQLTISSKTTSRAQLIKAILLLGVPLIAGELGTIAQQYADTMMVGHYGTDELAAAGFVNSIFYFVIFLTLGMSYASTPLIGAAFGCKDNKKVFRVFIESVAVNLIVGIFFVLLLLAIYFNIEWLFFDVDSVIGHQPKELLDISKEYLLMLIISVPFMTLFNACKQFLDGIGRTQVSMFIMLVANLLNILLNWCLIFGHCNMPELGLKGAGISTLISRFIQLVVISWVVYKTPIVNNQLHKMSAAGAQPTMNGILEQFKLGLPISIQLGLEIGIFNVCGIFMGWLGILPLAAHQTMYTISTLCFQILYGIGSAGTILISHYYGIKAWKNIRRTANTAYMAGLFCVVLLTVSIWVFFEPLSYCFTDDAGVVELMWLILPSFILYQFGDCTQIIFANAMRGLEDTKPLAWIAFFSYIIICLPLCYIFAFVLDWGVVGVWGGIPIGLFIAGVFFRYKFNKRLRILESCK